MGYENFVNGATATTLSSAIDGTTTTIPLTSATPFGTADSFRVICEQEVIRVGTISGSSFINCTRGADGTNALAHAIGSTIECAVTPGGIDQFQYEIEQAGTFANRPVTGKTGVAYFATDSPILSVWDGSAWKEFGPAFPITLPLLSGFTWVNQINNGTATISEASGALYLSTPALPGAGNELRLQVRSAPVSPFTVEIGMLVDAFQDNHWGAGIALMNAGGNIGTWHMGYSGVGGFKLFSQIFTNASTYSSDVFSVVCQVPYRFMFMKLYDDGTNYNMYVSPDLINWQLINQTVKATLITGANQIGFFINVNNVTFGMGATVFHWKVY